MQADLFIEPDSSVPERLPLQDAEVSYLPGFLNEGQALGYYSALTEQLKWQQDHIRMYGKQVKIPRLQAWYGDPEAQYTYSGLLMKPSPWQASLFELKQRCENVSGARFNSVLANWYRDNRDSMGWHSDDEPELGYQPVIASLSIGEVRDFDFRHKISGEKYRLPLESGSLLIMAGDTQKFWQHGISKRAKTLGGRINLTFRMIFPVEK